MDMSMNDYDEPAAENGFRQCAVCLTLNNEWEQTERGPVCVGCIEDYLTGRVSTCRHDWNDDDYCNLCGADGRA